MKLAKLGGSALVQNSKHIIAGLPVCIEKMPDQLTGLCHLLQEICIFGHREMRPVRRQGAPVIGLIGRRVENRQGSAEQFTGKVPRIIIAAMAGKAEVVAQHPPRSFWKIGVAIDQQIIAACLARNHDRPAFVDMKIDQRRRVERACLRNFPRFRHGNQELVVFKICAEFRSRFI